MRKGISYLLVSICAGIGPMFCTVLWAEGVDVSTSSLHQMSNRMKRESSDSKKMDAARQFVSALDEGQFLALAQEASKEKQYDLLGNVVMREFGTRFKTKLHTRNILSDIKDPSKDAVYRKFLLESLNDSRKKLTAEDASISTDLEPMLSDRKTDPDVRLSIARSVPNIIGTMEEAGVSSAPSHQAFSKSLHRILRDANENDFLRSAAISGSADIKNREVIPDLVGLLKDPAIAKKAAIARSACLALGSFRDRGSITTIGNLLATSKDEAIVGSAAFSLEEIGGEDVIPLLVANADRPDGSSYIGVAIRNNEKSLLNIFAGGKEQLLPYAIKGTKYIIDPAKYLPLLIRLAKQSKDPEIIRLCLERITESGDKAQVMEVLNGLPDNPIYHKQYEKAMLILTAVQLKIEPSNIPFP